MLVNFSNHPSAEWSYDQLKSAMIFGEIIDVKFPDIDPNWSEEELRQFGLGYIHKFMEYVKSAKDVVVVHIMGEHTFTYYVVNKLQSMGITCLASTTSRKAVNNGSQKVSEFTFVKFREYINCI